MSDILLKLAEGKGVVKIEQQEAALEVRTGCSAPHPMAPNHLPYITNGRFQIEDGSQQYHIFNMESTCCSRCNSIQL